MFVNIISEKLKDILCNKGCKLITSYTVGGKMIWVFDKSSVEFALEEYNSLGEEAFISDKLTMRFE